MTLKERITDDMKAAMRAKDSARLTAIRMLTAALKQKEVDERRGADNPLGDAEVLAIVDKLVKQRRDSVAAFEEAGRTDLVDKEKAEIDEAIRHAVASVGAVGPQAMGKVMAELRPQVAGRADMARVSALVKAALAG